MTNWKKRNDFKWNPRIEKKTLCFIKLAVMTWNTSTIFAFKAKKNEKYGYHNFVFGKNNKSKLSFPKIYLLNSMTFLNKSTSKKK